MNEVYNGFFPQWMIPTFPVYSRLFESGEDSAEQEEDSELEEVPPQPSSQSYAATVALSSTPPSSSALMGKLPLSTWNCNACLLVRGDSRVPLFSFVAIRDV